MNNILIASAMQEEINQIVNHFQLKVIDSINNLNLYQYSDNETKIYILSLGIGKVSSVISLTLFLQKYQVNKIINIGTSGSLDNKLEIGDLVVADYVAYHDVDVTSFGYEYGQLPGKEKYFKINNISYIENIIKNIDHNWSIGTVLTGDSFIDDQVKKEAIIKEFNNCKCIEMEATALVQCGQAYLIDTYIIRGISDNANGNATKDFNQYMHIVSEKYINLINILCN